ncbi:MAG: RnfABCDGE type electron transport complex subunit B [Planctomycetes bacterium]|nr:RnfABCDGE type electron transport complex subunit B [Planctomycetota bacterium]
MTELITTYAGAAVVVLASLAVFFAVVLAVADRFFQVKIDPRAARIEEILPRANCGSCGFGGCAAYAEALVRGEAAAGACTAGGPEAAKKIAAIMGLAVAAFVPKVAVIKCQGSRQNTRPRFRYVGEPDCRAAAATQYGQTACQYACLGLGTCVRACPFDAMITDEGTGLPRVLEDRCTACGTCAAVCPKNIIEILPKERYVHVLCRSRDPGKVVRQLCKAGCIACKMCEKACPVEGGAVHVRDNLAAVDTETCISCGKCVRACPVGCIGDFRKWRDEAAARRAGEQQVA